MVLPQQPYGSLDSIVDSGRRTLRPIGLAAADVARCTERLLAGVSLSPDVQIFRGARPIGTDLPPTAHTIAAGRFLLLVEGVAWPSGSYRTDGQGRVLCDDLGIGQSTSSLRATIACWRRALPPGHRVSGVVVVHRTDGGEYGLPGRDREVVWTFAEDALDVVRGRLGLGGRYRPSAQPEPVSRQTLDKLLAAVDAH